MRAAGSHCHATQSLYCGESELGSFRNLSRRINPISLRRTPMAGSPLCHLARFDIASRRKSADECYPAVTWMEEAQAILKAAEIKNKSK